MVNSLINNLELRRRKFCAFAAAELNKAPAQAAQWLADEGELAQKAPQRRQQEQRPPQGPQQEQRQEQRQEEGQQEQEPELQQKLRFCR